MQVMVKYIDDHKDRFGVEPSMLWLMAMAFIALTLTVARSQCGRLRGAIGHGTNSSSVRKSR
jgi:hypothetical protein